MLMFMLQDVPTANWRPAEDVGNHDQGRPGVPLQTANLRLRTMEKGHGEMSLGSSHGTVEPEVPQYVTWSTLLVMATQPATGEYRHKYKNSITIKAFTLLNSSRSSYSSIQNISKTLVELWGCRRIAQALVGSTLSGV